MGAFSGTGVMVGNYTSGGIMTVTLGNTGNSGTFSGVLANGANDTLNIVKIGAGVQTFSGANTYTGTTTINIGMLQEAQQVSLYNNTPASWTAANIIVAGGAHAGSERGWHG